MRDARLEGKRIRDCLLYILDRIARAALILFAPICVQGDVLMPVS